MKFRRHNSMLVPAAPEPRGAELAGGQLFQRAEAAVQFGSRQAALTVENAQKIRGGHVAFKGIAFDAAGNQVAVGIASKARARHDMVKAADVGRSAAKAVKAGAAIAIVDGLAKRPSAHEIGGLECGGGAICDGAQSGGRTIGFTNRTGVFGQAHFHEMAGFASFQQAQSAQLIEAAYGLAHRAIGDTQIVGHEHHREVQATLPDNKRMAQEIGIDGAVPNGQAETRHKNIFKLDPEELRVEFFVWHGLRPEKSGRDCVGAGLQADRLSRVV